MTATAPSSRHPGNDRVRTAADYLHLVVGKVAIGATGAVGTISCPGKAQPKIVRDGAGLYTFTFPSGTVMWSDVKVYGDSEHANNIHMVKVVDHDDSADKVQYGFYVETETNDAPVFTATDPTTGTNLRFCFAVAEGDV